MKIYNFFYISKINYNYHKVLLMEPSSWPPSSPSLPSSPLEERLASLRELDITQSAKEVISLFQSFREVPQNSTEQTRILKQLKVAKDVFVEKKNGRSNLDKG